MTEGPVLSHPRPSSRNEMAAKAMRIGTLALLVFFNERITFLKSLQELPEESKVNNSHPKQGEI